MRDKGPCSRHTFSAKRGRSPRPIDIERHFYIKRIKYRIGQI